MKIRIRALTYCISSSDLMRKEELLILYYLILYPRNVNGPASDCRCFNNNYFCFRIN
uniref:Uncharacterized protein MANES_13G128000 n=1 Tax=Rhizophora mucronata TaxID=61149 RepID=A0A2P2NFX0_RHIMU